MNTATAQCRSSLKAGIYRLLPGRHMLTVIGLLLVLMQACVMPVHAEETVGDSELFSRLSATDRRAAFAAAAELGRRESEINVSDPFQGSTCCLTIDPYSHRC